MRSTGLWKGALSISSKTSRRLRAFKTLFDLMKGECNTFERAGDVLHTSGETSYFSTFHNPGVPPGWLTDVASCAKDPCVVPQDCVLADWTDWTTCSAECNGCAPEATQVGWLVVSMCTAETSG